MSAKITEALKELTKDVLTEESLEQIEAAFHVAVEQKATLQIEAALAKQDTDHADKVKQLLEAIDRDHTVKLEKLVEAIDSNHLDKLKNVITKYETVVSEEAGTFKTEMISNISDYLDLYIEKSVPVEAIKEASENKQAQILLDKLRQRLGIDLAVAQDSIKTAIVDGKQRIDEATTEAATLTEKNENLQNELSMTRSRLVLEQRTSNMNEQKKKYMYKVLGDKTAEFITENFEYTLQLFDRNEVKALDKMKAEAHAQAQPVDRPVVSEEELLEESSPVQQGPDDDWTDAPFRGAYMDELRKF
jgi:hypothetical protein